MGRILGVVAAGVVLLGACGDGGDGADGGRGGDGRTRAYVDAVSASILENDETGLDVERADCMAAASVAAVGVDAFTDAGVSPEELGDVQNLSSLDVEVPDGAAERLGVALGECDVADHTKNLMVEVLSSQTGTDLSPDAAACLVDNLNDRVVTEALARLFLDGADEHMEEPLIAAAGTCPPVMTEVLLAQLASDLPPSAEACVSDFVEENAGSVVRLFASPSSGVTDELAARLAAACPELGAVRN